MESWRTQIWALPQVWAGFVLGFVSVLGIDLANHGLDWGFEKIMFVSPFLFICTMISLCFFYKNSDPVYEWSRLVKVKVF